MYLDSRILRYFLMVAKEQNFTRAAKILNITQPTLSRQLADLEEKLGVQLFNRFGKKVTLTQEGIILKRRALEILELEEKTLQELKHSDEVIEGTITIGCGEFAAMEKFALICKSYKKKFPKVRIVIHTANADSIYEMMERGKVDIGIFLEPISTEGLDYVRIEKSDYWVVTMPANDPLVEKEFVRKEDIAKLPLIIPKRLGVQSELENWFGKDFKKLDIAMESNLGTNAAVMVKNGLGYQVSIEGAGKYWDESYVTQRRLYPEISTSTVIAWRRNIPYSKAITKFIEEINAYKA